MDKNDILIKIANDDCLKYFSKKKLNKTQKRHIKQAKTLNNNFKLSRFLMTSFKKRGHFCISHKDNLSAVAYSKNKNFGIDIEYLKTRNFDNIVEFCFNKHEKEIFDKSKEKLNDFYKIFTAKEAILKANNLHFYDFDKIGYCKYKKAFLNQKGEIEHIFYHSKEQFILCVCSKFWPNITIKEYL